MESLSKEKSKRLNEIATEVASSLGLVVLGLNARGVPSRPVIEVILDGARLVSLEDCQAISQKLHEAIENEKITTGNYRLDVLSPGLDEPIIHDFQFQRTIGHLVEVKAGQTTTGVLKAFSPAELILTLRDRKKTGNGEEISIPRDTIDSVYARADFGKA